VIAAAAVVPLIFSVATDDVFSAPKLVSLWTILAFVCALFVWGVATRRVPRIEPIPVLDGFVAAFFGVSVVSFFLSVDIEQSFWGERLQRQGLATLILYLLFFYAGRAYLKRPAQLVLLIRAVALGASVVAGYALIQWIGLDPIWTEQPTFRVSSTIGQPNALGAFLAFTMILTLVAAATSKGLPKQATWVFGASVQATALVLTVSRGAYIAAAVGICMLVFYGALHARQLLRQLAIFLIVVASMATTLLIVSDTARDAASQISGRMSAITEVSEAGSVRMHLDLWRVAGAIIADHPILGTGPDTYAVVFPSYRDATLSTDRAAVFRPLRVESPHNALLAVAVGSGLFALAFFLGILAVSYRQLWMARADSALLGVVATGVAGALTAHLVGDLFITAEVTGTWLFWLVLGSCLAVTVTRNGSARGSSVEPSLHGEVS
jgi:O-antigen ligase